jgi:DNA-binding transcriptional regulator YdaS (Cro superfamily)
MTLSEYLNSQPQGAATKLALDIGVPVASISYWSNGVRQVPAERCFDIEKATVGAVRCEDLRPDIADRFTFLRGTAKAA